MKPNHIYVMKYC